MLRHRRLLFVLLALNACAMAWPSARMQSPLRRLTNTPEEAVSLNPSMSGDGSIVAFESTADVAGAGGDGFHAIRANVAVEPATFAQIGATRAPAPAISQDGSRIAFASKDDPLGTNDDHNSEIFLYDRAKLLQVTRTSPGDFSSRIADGNFSPSISDDGQFIAFSSNRNLTSQNSDNNLEILVYDTVAASFTQATNSSDIVGFTDPKISGDGRTLVYIRDTGQTPSSHRDLLRQNRQTLLVNVLTTNAQSLALTYGRAISDDGSRVVWSAQTATNSSQVFLYDGRNGGQTRQVTALGARSTDVPLHPSISGNGSRVSFATRRAVPGMGSNGDTSVELYTFDIPSGTFARVTNVISSSATAEVVSSLNDDAGVVAFNYPRLISGAVGNGDLANNSEIYVTATPPPPASGTLTVLNRAAAGHEPATVKAVSPDSIAMALGGALSFTTFQAQRQSDGSFPTTVNGTTVKINGQPAQILFVSPTEVHFHVPVTTALGTAEVVTTNSDGFESRGSVTMLRSAPGVFTRNGDGIGEGMILNADTLQTGPFDPSNGDLRLIVFSTGARHASSLSITAGGRALALESLVNSSDLPGLDEVHVLLPADLRGAGLVELVMRADTRESNPVSIEFAGDAGREVLINEFLADPPGAKATDLIGDANRDGERDASEDEFVELVNTTTHDINLSGYRILTRSGSATSDTLRHVFASGSILRSCSALVVFGGGNSNFNPSDPALGGAEVLKASSGSLTLINSSGVITLQDQASAIINLVAYGGPTGLNADDNQSLTRAPDVNGNFTQHQSASGGARLFSPGTELDGAPFRSCTPLVARVEVLPPTASITLGAQQQFTARAFDAGNSEMPGVIFSWQSSNTSIARVDENGLATGTMPGLSEIRATGRSVQSLPANLTVTQPPPVLTSLIISPSNTTIGAGGTEQFTAQAKDQFGEDIGGVTISFTSNNPTVATVDSVSSTSGAGLATATLLARVNGTAEIRAAATDGLTNVTSSPAVIFVEPGAGQLLISELRTRGPNGAADEFVEIYNPTPSALTIGGLKIRASNGAGTIGDRVTITAGMLGPGCHYLLANSSGFSGSVTANQTYGTGITDDGGVALTGSNGTRIIDAVGLSNGSALQEGTTLASLAGNSDRSYERKPGGTFGNGFDTNDNGADFALSLPSNPQNSSSNCLDTNSADLSITKTASPDPVTVGSTMTYTLVITNNGAATAENVTVTDNLPAGATFVSCASTGGGVCGGSGNNRTITFSLLSSGSSRAISLVVTADGPADTTISNTATVTSTVLDTNNANNTATATTFIQAPLPLLSINDVAANEGDSGTTSFSFTVSLAAPAPAAGVAFDIATQDNTATTANGDYIPKNLAHQTIPFGEQTYKFDVTANGDTLVEASETFLANVTNVVNASVADGQGLGTIENDDSANLVMSQVYAGGGNSGAQFTNDFVELFNRGLTTINFVVTPYSLQYAGATANFGSSKVDLTTGTMAPGQYFLVQLSSGGSNGAPLSDPDATGTIAMAASAGKVALVSGTTALSGSGCPLAAAIADFVGYGTTAACFEGSGRAPAPGNTTAALRKSGGCTDSNDNAVDFFVSVPFPRNATSSFNNCVAGPPPNLTIDDVNVTEGNSGINTATFTVSLSAPAPSSDIAFDIATQDDTATTANNDYGAKTLTNQLIPAGQQTYSFTVNVNGDRAIENNESFFVNVTNVSAATVVKGQGVGTIQNDDLPTLTINDVALTEGNSGVRLFTFTVGLSATAPAPVTFDLATEDDTATVADNDYVARALTSQTIPAGSSNYAFDVAVNGDASNEANEIFLVNVSNVSGATVGDAQGTGTIQNDDSPILTIDDVSQNEGDSGTIVFTFTVTSSLPAPAGGITFNIATADGTAHDDMPPSEDDDYVAKSLGAQTIATGNTSFTFDVAVNGDTLVETNEVFFVTLSDAVNATIADGQAQGTIQNDDTPLLVISQVYGGGGNTGATYTNDFIEIFNRGTTSVDFSITPYSVQYAAATSNFSTNKTDLTSGILLPGHYFLVQENTGGAVGAALSAPDATGTINLAATAGKVALVIGTAALTGNGCPLSVIVADFLGYGSTASCSETAPISVSSTNSNARAVIRTASCIDSNNNSADFSNPTTEPVARNTATTPAPCP